MVNDSRINVLVTEIISVQTMDVSLFIEFANVTNYEHLLVFVRYNRKPDLTSNTYDKMFLIKVTENLERGEYYGCFKKLNAEALKEDYLFTISTTGSLDTCIDVCHAQGFNFAGIQSMGECYCLNDVEQLRLTNDTECSSPCFRQNLLPCDGVEESYSVYSTGLEKRIMVIIDQSIVQGRVGNFYISFAPLPVGKLP
ncbi:oxt [Bugula neritina]|uniref:Oxt n=1 Tax=Bugula neritina TaxID=10212 RepID=A0A7J7K4V6_BUGNE|nr:oxt [Bugula neritina]